METIDDVENEAERHGYEGGKRHACELHLADLDERAGEARHHRYGCERQVAGFAVIHTAIYQQADTGYGDPAVQQETAPVPEESASAVQETAPVPAECKAAAYDMFLQYQNLEFDITNLTARILDKCASENMDSSDLKIYVKPEDSKAYYVCAGGNSFIDL